jgi:hypothetical protein
MQAFVAAYKNLGRAVAREGGFQVRNPTQSNLEAWVPGECVGCVGMKRF